MTEARRRVKEVKEQRLAFKHIGREDNALADWLCRLALEQQADQVGVERVFPTLKEHSPPLFVLVFS